MVYSTEILVFLGSLSAALTAILVDQYIHHVKEQCKEYKERQRVQELLNSDIQNMYTTVKNNLHNLETIISHLRSTDDFKKLDHDLMETTSDNLKEYLKFNFWQAIESSGLLLRIENNDLKEIQKFYHMVANLNFALEHYILKYDQKLDFEISDEKELTQYWYLVEKYAEDVKEEFEEIEKEFESLKNIKWITLRNIQSKNIQTNVRLENIGIYVTENGITVYPDGTKVDKKGTIIETGSS